MNITRLRQSARQIWDAGIQRASPAACLRKTLHLQDGILSVDGRRYPLGGRLVVIGAGKAGATMVQGVEEILGDEITAGLVVTKYGHRLPTSRVEIAEAGHPIPDRAGTGAVEQTREMLADLAANDIVLCLISGGASALWPSPVEGITLAEKQELTAMLLRAGATVHELNAVRKHLSAIKGGQLAGWAAPAQVISLIISDVIGDPVDFIGSGPTAPDTTTFADALAIVTRYGVPAPESVLRHLRDGTRGKIAETPKPGDPAFNRVQNVIIGNNRLLVDAAREEAIARGFNTLILATEVEGEAQEVARFFAAIAREIGSGGNPLRPPACVLAAGETTVTVQGDGQGGRNQEMALAWAIAMAIRPPESACCFASVATDGTDGPTNAAGGLVDPLTCARAVELGLIPLQYLRANDSMNFLRSTGDLIVTGPSGTNLMDLQILLVG